MNFRLLTKCFLIQTVKQRYLPLLPWPENRECAPSVGVSGRRSSATDEHPTRKPDSTRRWSGASCIPTLECGNNNIFNDRFGVTAWTKHKKTS